MVGGVGLLLLLYTMVMFDSAMTRALRNAMCSSRKCPLRSTMMSSSNMRDIRASRDKRFRVRKIISNTCVGI